MNKNAITRFSKAMIVLQLFILIFAFVFLYKIAPRINYPNDGSLLNGNMVKFDFENSKAILIDDNPEFSSPINIDAEKIKDVFISFPPGTYYWKGVGILETEPKKFTINSNVGLEIQDNQTNLKNVGNVALNVSIEDENGLSGLTILDVDIEYPVDSENETNYRGEQYGK